MSRMLDSQASEPVLRRLATDRSGVTAIVTGIGLTMLLGFAGAAIDVAYWLNSMRGMQSAADQAAFSAAVAAGSTGCSGTAYSQQARAVAAARGYIDGQGATVTVTCRASDASYTVRIEQEQPRWFTNLCECAAGSGPGNLAGGRDGVRYLRPGARRQRGRRRGDRDR